MHKQLSVELFLPFNFYIDGLNVKQPFLLQHYFKQKWKGDQDINPAMDNSIMCSAMPILEEFYGKRKGFSFRLILAEFLYLRRMKIS